ncbi:IPT/TIG domain-containing protein [Streptomyces sp. NBC_01190]|uniref:IPT/TIG domain-containing protein n=1 Tax=Streptomyces sp. NBC_01190 TaxID=2903767 RepID=UPI00386EE9C2|nr:IPT/TIG domain-containing protein [Streptomyces sp. NBC_01190]
MSMSPNQGSTGGGTLVTFTGTNLAGATAVTFGTKPATGVTQVSPTQVTAISPAGSGTVGVTVTTVGGISNPVPFFYVDSPFLCSLSAASGPLAGGGTITITGVKLSTATSVRFGANSAVPTVVSDRQLTVTVPAGAAVGPVAVSVITPGGTSNSLTYTYVGLPTATAISPITGTSAGGTAFTLTGTNLVGAGVTFNGVPATAISVNPAGTSLTGTTPAGTSGNASPRAARATA